MESEYIGTVWAFQRVCKEDMCPDTIKTVFLKQDSDILDATEALKIKILQEIYDRCDDPEEVPDDPECLLNYINNRFNCRSLSYFVVRIFPSCEENLQGKF